MTAGKAPLRRTKYIKKRGKEACVEEYNMMAYLVIGGIAVILLALIALYFAIH